jgi:DNA end-binding protein Ku
MSTLVYADEVVPVSDVEDLAGLDDIDLSDREVKMAEVLVDSLSAPFDPAKYHDDYRVQVLDLINKKAQGEAFELPAPAGEAPQVVDLMAALEASVAAAKQARSRHPSAHPVPAGKKAAQRSGRRAARPRDASVRRSLRRRYVVEEIVPPVSKRPCRRPVGPGRMTRCGACTGT